MKKVLLVDNDRFILEVLKDALTEDGHEVKTAEDGLSALDVLEAYAPDVIFVDMVMPNIDGRRLCKILRKMEDLKGALLVSLSATSGEEFGNVGGMDVDISLSKGPLEEMTREVRDVVSNSRLDTTPSPPPIEAGPKDLPRQRVAVELFSGMKHLEVILEQMEEGIFEVASDGRVVYANRGASILTNLPEEDILGRYLPHLFAEGDLERVRGFLGGGREQAKHLSGDHPLTLNGYLVTLDIQPVPGTDGKHIVILNNVTDQKHAEASLRKSEERYRVLFENANDAIFVLQEGAVKFPNRRGIEMFGHDPRDLYEMHFLDIVYPEDAPAVKEICQQRLRDGDLPAVHTFRIVPGPDEELWVELTALRIDWEERPAVLCFLKDITEKRRLETHLQQSQRMASIGTLAGGIAHEFNNLLMGIQANASLVLYGKSQDSPEYDRLKHIEMHVQRGAELTRHLLSFARKGKYEPKPTDLNKLVKRTEELFARAEKEIRVHPDYQEDIMTVEVDPTQIEQVLISLYINARQAMPEGGQVFLETRNTQLSMDVVRSYGIAPGRYVKMSVRDTGVGMDAETREQIFDPFFTTRGVGQGVGLGLAAAYGIIRNHGGFMDVSSEKGKGSAFHIYLPAMKHAEPRKPEKPGTGNF